MKTIQIMAVGTFVWFLVFCSFILLGLIAGIKDSQTQQGLVVGTFIILFSYLGAHLYYKKGDTTNGLIVGIIMTTTALVLDAIITVPYIMGTTGDGYYSFYSNPLLWILASLNIAVIYFYWKFKVNSNANGKA